MSASIVSLLCGWGVGEEILQEREKEKTLPINSVESCRTRDFIKEIEDKVDLSTWKSHK